MARITIEVTDNMLALAVGSINYCAEMLKGNDLRKAALKEASAYLGDSKNWSVRE